MYNLYLNLCEISKSSICINIQFINGVTPTIRILFSGIVLYWAPERSRYQFFSGSGPDFFAGPSHSMKSQFWKWKCTKIGKWLPLSRVLAIFHDVNWLLCRYVNETILIWTGNWQMSYKLRFQNFIALEDKLIKAEN